MRRRSFLASGMTSILAAAADLSLGQSSESQTSNVPDIYRLTSKYRTDAGKALFTKSQGPEETPPHIYLHFDTKAMKFLNPIEVVADLSPGAYTLDVSLVAFGASSDLRQKLGSGQKKDIQLTLKVDANQSSDKEDTLSWLFMNAIDVFLSATKAPTTTKNTVKASGTASAPAQTDTTGQLTTFKQNNQPTAALKPISQISIPQGSVFLQVIALGQNKQGFWKAFLAGITKLSASPIFASLGLPALVPEALGFVNSSLNQLAHTDGQLEPIWLSARIPFGIFRDSNADFKLKGGYWVIVDRAYALSTNYLQNHQLDLRGQTFSLLNSSNQMADTSYLVTNLTFTASKTSKTPVT
jgi:hypothetical protein